MVIIDGKKYYTVHETAQILEMSDSAISYRIMKGYLGSITVSGTRHISDADIKAYAAEKRRQNDARKQQAL